MDPRTQWAISQLQRFLREGNPAAVVELGEHLLAREDESLDTYRLAASSLALAHERLGQWRPALDWFRRCLVLDPAEPLVLAGYGRVLLKMGEHAGAAALFRRLARLHPERPEFHAAAGTALLHVGEAGSALPYLLRARELDPASPYVLNDLAGAHLLEGDLEAALSAYKQAVELLLPPDARKLGCVSPRQLELARDIRESIEEVRAALALRRHAAGATAAARIADVYPVAEPSPPAAALQVGEAAPAPPAASDVAASLSESKVRALLLESMLEQGRRPRQVLAALHLWCDFLEFLPEAKRARAEHKPERWAAAVIYAVGRIEGAAWALQADLARRFNVAQTTVSRYYGFLRRTLALEDNDPRYSPFTSAHPESVVVNP